MQRNLIFFVAVILLLAAGLATIVTRTITRKIALLNDNAARLSAQMPLPEKLVGSDELVAIDSALHTAAGAIQNHIKDERLLIGNATDLICLIDEQGTIIAANPAAEQVAGFKPNDLIGKYFLEIVADDDHSKMLDCVEVSKRNEASSVSLRLTTENRSFKNVICSLRWSAEEKRAICIFHDQTERIANERSKRAIIAMVTHDLRSPLMTIEHVIELLLDGDLGTLSEPGKRLALETQSSVLAMLSAISSLLKVEKEQSEVG